MLEELAALFREFEGVAREGSPINYDTWARRAFEIIMGKEPDMDAERSAYRYPDTDESSTRASRE
jgi:hypothetical protein